jgi:hypothetical protein
VLSVSRGQARLAVAVTSASLLGGFATGCSTTQEKAEKQQARAEHILQARKQRQRQKKNGKHEESGKDAKHGGGERQ